MDPNYWWQLTFRDGEIIDIPPHFVPNIQKQIKEGKSIVTKHWSKPVHQYVSFEKTGRPFNAKLIASDLEEEAAKAFKEPIETESGAILAAWVKRAVSRREWQNSYAKNPYYKLLTENGHQVIIAYLKAVHNIKTNEVELTAEEVRKLKT